MNKTILIAMLVAFGMVVGCSSTDRSHPGGFIGGVAMAPADFSIAGQTVGDSCSTRILGIDFSRLFHTDNGKTGSLSGGGFPFNLVRNDHALSNATFNALAKVENSTYFMTGQVKRESNHFLWLLYYNDCVTVHGQAVTIRSTK